MNKVDIVDVNKKVFLSNRAKERFIRREAKY